MYALCFGKKLRVVHVFLDRKANVETVRLHVGTDYEPRSTLYFVPPGI